MSKKDWNISNPKKLHINHASLSEISLDWTKLDMLEDLDLSYNNLSSIDKEIGTLRNIKKLDLSNNALTLLPESLVYLSQLEFLNLSNNKLNEIPSVITRLPALKTLRLKGNSITEVPDSIHQLFQLEYLDLSFNPIKELPSSIRHLSQLTRLNCTSNQFKTFPYVLLYLEKLEYLNELDLHFRLKIETPKLMLFYKVLVLLRKRNASFEQKKAAFQIFFYQHYKGDLKLIFPLLRINYAFFSKTIRRFLVDRSSDKIGPHTSLVILGKTPWLAHKSFPSNFCIDYEVRAHSSHILAGQQLSKKQTDALTEEHQFIDEKTLLANLYPDRALTWLAPQKEKLIDLLMSAQNEHIALALQISEDDCLQSDLLTELLWAYTCIDVGNQALRRAIKSIFYQRIPGFDPKYLPNANFKFYTPHKTEAQIRKDIIRICRPYAAWDGDKIADYIFNKVGAAYEYILLNSPLATQKKWLAQFVKGTTFCLSPLKKLSFLPQAIVLFPTIEIIDLKFCSFSKLPDCALLEQLKDLHTLDLRNNPISSIPRKEFIAVSAYRLFLSKH